MSTAPEQYTPPANAFKGRRILVTGAGDGLGRATALACARLGAQVVLLGRTVKKLEAVYDAIEAAGGPTPAIYPLHLAGASWKDYAELAATLEQEFGGLDGLVHCAVHFKSFAPLQDIDAKEWLETLQVNLTAAFALTRHCLPLLASAADASVVFVSDRQGRESRAFGGAYAVSKAAIEQMMRIWAADLEGSRQLRINSYDPGPMRTALRLKGFPGETLEQSPLPDSAVSTLLWLLGSDSKGVSGQAL